jgi:hypothetical protein
MWDFACEAVCRRHPELVAVFASAEGRLALLLQHTLTPTRAERSRWLAETRRAARAISSELSAAGAGGDVTVLQGRPLPEVARIMRRWRCQYDGDPDRRRALGKLVNAGSTIPAIDPWAIDGRSWPAGLAMPAESRDLATPGVLDWYGDMVSSWLAIEPRARRLLVLETHRWIVERTLAAIASGQAPAHRDLTADGQLASRLLRLVPRAERSRWTTWVQLTLRDLRRALAWPPERRSDAWVRWLFLIPYSIPVLRLVNATGREGRLHGPHRRMKAGA